jgi:hypothetical protein
MELAPQSGTRSPTSPFQYNTNSQPLYDYPSPAQSDSRYRPTDSLQGLGLYSCPVPSSMSLSSTVEERGSATLPQSSSASSSWPTTTPMPHRHSTPRSSHPTPNMLPAEYEFAPYNPTVSAPYIQNVYSTQAAKVAILPASPVPSGNTSQRSSFSSAPASEVFTQAGSIHSYTPRIKMEDHVEFSNGNDPMMLSSPQLNDNLLVTSASSYPGTLEVTFYQDQSSLAWPKVDYSVPQDLPSISSLPLPPCERRLEHQDQNSPQVAPEQRRAPSTIARTRQPRKLTTKEDANFQCHVKGCGKLFGRSYNFKAHMETHDAGREYPFPCSIKDCAKKFVRKTDLQRHHQSVHMKQRNHRCDFCSRYFARKDTLRRYVEILIYIDTPG